MARTLFNSRTPTIKPYLPAARPTKLNGSKAPTRAASKAADGERFEVYVRAAGRWQNVAWLRRRSAKEAKESYLSQFPHLASGDVQVRPFGAAAPGARKAPAKAKPRATKANGSTSQRMGGANRAQARDPSTFASESAARGAKCSCVADARYPARVRGGWAAVCRRGTERSPTAMVAHGPGGIVLAVGVPATRSLINSSSH